MPTSSYFETYPRKSEIKQWIANNGTEPVFLSFPIACGGLNNESPAIKHDFYAFVPQSMCSVTNSESQLIDSRTEDSKDTKAHEENDTNGEVNIHETCSNMENNASDNSDSDSESDSDSDSENDASENGSDSSDSSNNSHSFSELIFNVSILLNLNLGLKFTLLFVFYAR